MRTNYKGRAVDIDVRQDGWHAASHIVVVVHDPDDAGHDQRVEYVTADADLADAFGAGLELAQALVDGRLH